jgi:hypothetical protein
MPTIKIKPYAPGSPDAIKAGCICPVEKNNNGQGAYIKANGQPIFWFSKHCPLHGKANELKKDIKIHEVMQN